MAIKSFRRIEKKYIINSYQKNELLKVVKQHMEFDPYCIDSKTYHIQNLYLDTENNTLISNSIRKPSYKEKLRLRKYTGMKSLFFEIKKKVNGVVGKRRVLLTPEEVKELVYDHVEPVKDSYLDNQIIHEIKYCLDSFPSTPKVYIAYDRLGFFDKENKEFRLTIDERIYSSRSNLMFDQDVKPPYLLPEGYSLLEIKSTVNFPLWLVNILNELGIFSSTFSKYGTEYMNYLKGGLVVWAFSIVF